MAEDDGLSNASAKSEVVGAASGGLLWGRRLICRQKRPPRPSSFAKLTVA